MGSIELAHLTHNRVKAWRNSLADAKPRVRRKPGETGDVFREVDASDPEVQRKRQATANRILTVLKAALNHAHHADKVRTKDAWEKVKPFREVDVPKVRYLAVDECKRLIDACPADFRELVRAALYTGCRYGELTALRVDAFNSHSGTIHVERSKSGKGRYIPLTAEGAAFFASVTQGKRDAETIFTHAEGPRSDDAWESSQQRIGWS